MIKKLERWEIRERLMDALRWPNVDDDSIKNAVNFIIQLLDSERDNILVDMDLEQHDTVKNLGETGDFCAGWNKCKEYVEWVMAGKPTI